jgi:hypothetical protein
MLSKVAAKPQGSIAQTNDIPTRFDRGLSSLILEPQTGDTTATLDQLQQYFDLFSIANKLFY